MKFALAELNKLKFPYHFEEEMDLKEDLVGLEDILDIKDTKVSETMYYLSEGKYKIDFEVKSHLVVESAISLKEIPLDLNIAFTETFNTKDDDESFKINGQTLDTKEAVITNILINKPMSQSLEGEVLENEMEEEKEEKINEAFKSLKDLL